MAGRRMGFWRKYRKRLALYGVLVVSILGVLSSVTGLFDFINNHFPNFNPPLFQFENDDPIFRGVIPPKYKDIADSLKHKNSKIDIEHYLKLKDQGGESRKLGLQSLNQAIELEKGNCKVLPYLHIARAECFIKGNQNDAILNYETALYYDQDCSMALIPLRKIYKSMLVSMIDILSTEAKSNKTCRLKKTVADVKRISDRIVFIESRLKMLSKKLNGFYMFHDSDISTNINTTHNPIKLSLNIDAIQNSTIRANNEFVHNVSHIESPSLKLSVIKANLSDIKYDNQALLMEKEVDFKRSAGVELKLASVSKKLSTTNYKKLTSLEDKDLISDLTTKLKSRTSSKICYAQSKNLGPPSSVVNSYTNDATKVSNNIELFNSSRFQYGSNNRALVIGLNSYDNDKNNTLRFAELDASKMAKALERLGFDTKVLTGELATKSRIMDQIMASLNSDSEDSVFTLYFAGHGFSDITKNAFILTYSIDKAEAITLIDLQKILSVRSGRSYIILDSCFEEMPYDLTSHMSGVNYTANKNNIKLLLGSGIGEKAIESIRLESGLATYTILEYLDKVRADRKSNKYMVLDGLLDYVPRRTLFLANKIYKIDQNPFVAGCGSIRTKPKKLTENRETGKPFVPHSAYKGK